VLTTQGAAFTQVSYQLVYHVAAAVQFPVTHH